MIILKGKSVILRPLESYDIPELVEMANDASNFDGGMRHALNSPGELMTEVQRNNLIENDRFVLAVLERESRDLIGSVHVYPTHSMYSIPEVGVYIYPKEKRGRGYGFEVTALTVGLLFDSRPVPKVTMVTNTKNAFLFPVLERFGWRREAVMRNVFFYAGDYQDYAVYSLTRRSWETARDIPLVKELYSGGG